MDQVQDFKSLQNQIQKALISTTKISGQVSAEDLAFQRSLNPEVGKALDEQSERLLALASALIKSAVSISELKSPVLEDADDVENNWRNVVDVVDSLLEKSDTCLDEYTGVIKRKEVSTSEHSTAATRKAKPPNAMRTQNLVKPQLMFDAKPDNFDVSPWAPILKTKPHATIPLEKSLDKFKNEWGREQYRHPYETEIKQLKYPESIYKIADPILYLPVETTSATFVDTEEGVMQMLEELKQATEIVIDLEHHDARSYVGLVSLMQVSTRNKDWIVDTLKPWRQNLQVLNEVFADPRIVKVFHGAFMDIVWLQRDLGLYVVGLFDTHWASRTLGYAGGSLAFLLKKFINFDADKQYQMADWRIRPLPEEMFFYARADTHYLLYIFDMMRNELVERSVPNNPDEDRIEMVLQKSKEVSLLRYERQVYNSESGRGPGGWYSLLVKTPALFSKEQFSVFKAVHEWRDKIARTDDDSPAFIMPQHIVFSIAKIMPMDMISLLSVCHPVSHSVKSRTGDLLDIVKSAKVAGNFGPSMMDVLRPDSLGTVAKANIPAVAEKNTPRQETMVAVVDGGELKSESSSFWGGAFGSSIWDAPTLTHTSDVRLAVPLPTLSSELFASGGGVPLSKPIQQYPKEEQVNVISLSTRPAQSSEAETFTLKPKAGGKRKSEQISSADDAEEDDTEGGIAAKKGAVEENLNGGASMKISKVNSRKADKKALKKAKAERKRRRREEKAAESRTTGGYEDDDESMEDGVTEEGQLEEPSPPSLSDDEHGGVSLLDSTKDREKPLSKSQMKKIKKAERAAKKLAKQERKRLREEEEEEEGKDMEDTTDAEEEQEEEEEEEPFDYSKAESVLHSKKPGHEGGKRDKKGKDKGKGAADVKKPFDPYSKSADAPKGMRRAQTERAGRSQTFKK